MKCTTYNSTLDGHQHVLKTFMLKVDKLNHHCSIYFCYLPYVIQIYKYSRTYNHVNIPLSSPTHDLDITLWPWHSCGNGELKRQSRWRNWSPLNVHAVHIDHRPHSCESENVRGQCTVMVLWRNAFFILYKFHFFVEISTYYCCSKQELIYKLNSG